MCLLTTVDMKDMYNKDRTFDSLKDFEQWYSLGKGMPIKHVL